MTPTDTSAVQPAATPTPAAASSTPTAPAAPTSTPAAQPQPNQETFPIDALALFHTYTRDSYLAAFGVAAPPWDPTRLSKSWFDSTVDTSQPANVASYQMIGQDSTGAWTELPYTMPASEAATVNIPGAVVYPPYVIAPTGATRGGSPINPAYLSLQADAQAVMTALSGSGLFDDGATAILPNVYPADEPRRSWSFLLNGVARNVGQLWCRNTPMAWERPAIGMSPPATPCGSPTLSLRPVSTIPALRGRFPFGPCCRTNSFSPARWDLEFRYYGQTCNWPPPRPTAPLPATIAPC